jgi:TonB family protein
MRTLTTLRYTLPLLLLLWPCGVSAQDRGIITSVAVSPDGGRLATGSLDSLVTLWDASARGQAATLRAHYSYVYAVAFSRDGKTLASGGGDRSVKLWEVGTGRQLRTLRNHGASVETLAFSPDGRTLASGDHFGVIMLWEFESGRLLHVLDQAGPAASHLAFGADGKSLVSGGDGVSFVWDVATGQKLGLFTVERFMLSAVALSPDGRTAAAAGCIPPRFWKAKCSVRLWDVPKGRESHSFGVPSEVEALAFSRDGKLMAGAGSLVAPRLWDTSTGATVATLEKVRALFFSLAFDDGAQRLTGLFATDNLPARVVWDVSTRKFVSPPTIGLPPLPPIERPDEAGQTSLPTEPASPGVGVGGLAEERGVGPGLGPGRGGNVGGGGGGFGGGVGGGDYSGVFTRAQVTEPFRITSKPEPQFTEKARRHNVTGVVRLRAVLTSSGVVNNIVVLRELPFFLTDEAVRAARAIKFVPAQKDGRAVSQYVTLEYNFNIY